MSVLLPNQSSFLTDVEVALDKDAAFRELFSINFFSVMHSLRDFLRWYVFRANDADHSRQTEAVKCIVAARNCCLGCETISPEITP